jgi:hypothetical protein
MIAALTREDGRTCHRYEKEVSGRLRRCQLCSDRAFIQVKGDMRHQLTKWTPDQHRDLWDSYKDLKWLHTESVGLTLKVRLLVLSPCS